MTKQDKRLLALLISVLLAGILIGGTAVYELTKTEPDNKEAVLLKKIETERLNQYQNTRLSWEAIDLWMDYFGIREKQIVKAQIILESDSLRSNLCVQHNNLFGMTWPTQRTTTATYKAGIYAGYPSFIESIKDYWFWQQKYTGGDYYEFLENSGYAGDSSYIWKLKEISGDGF
jgi:hypothetical protein